MVNYILLGIVFGIVLTLIEDMLVKLIMMKKKKKADKDLKKCQGCVHFFECAGRFMKKGKCEFFKEKGAGEQR